MVSDTFKSRMEELKKKIGRHGEEHPIYLPYDLELKTEARKAGAVWVGEDETFAYYSDEPDHPLEKYQHENWVDLNLPADMAYEGQKQAKAFIREETTLTCTTKEADEWHTKILICDETADLIKELMKMGFIMEMGEER